MGKIINQSWYLARVGMFVMLFVGIGSCSKEGDPQLKNSDKKITSFVFLLTKNAIPNNVAAIIDEDNKTISANMPAGTDVTGLLPDIEISPSASVSPNTVQDFTNPITYTVTAEDGSQVVYSANIQVALSQRQILQAILDANSEHTLNWNLSTTADLGSLDGVTLDVDGNISTLDLREKNLSIIPKEIGQLSSLTELILIFNKLTSLPAEIGNLTNLTTLNLYDNKLSSLPTEIGNLTNLTTLALTSNNLTSLPTEIRQLTSLTSLSLADNNFSSLPAEIGNLTNLTELYLFNNSLSSLPIEIGNLTSLTSLVLSSNNLTSLPKEFWHLTSLTSLILQLNNLTSISPDIGKLTSLKELSLSYNNLSSLPAELGFLTKLTNLYLQGMDIGSIPQCLCYWKEFNNTIMLYDGIVPCTTVSQKDALISIYSANPGNTLGWGVDNFPGVEFTENGSARYLTMNNKNLTRLPDNIDRLTALEGLIVSDNALGVLPSMIGYNSSLIVIAAANTNIPTVPASFGSLTNLALLSLEGNPITSIPSSVCDQQVSNGGILTILTDPGEGCD